MAIKIGTGSWADPEYAGLLYPRGFPDLKLSGYAMWFNHVEVNSTYYATPRKETVKQWVADTPDDFLFDIKLHRMFSISPEKTAKAGRLLDLTLDALEPLREAKKLGAFLLVMAPFFKPGKRRLEELDTLIEKIQPHSLAVELRHDTWVEGEARETTLAYFRERRITWVGVDMPQIPDAHLMPPTDEVPYPKLAYLRLHGRNPGYKEAKTAAEGHNYFYPEKELQELAARIRVMAKKAKDLRVVCNNHFDDYAPRTAMILREMLEID